MKQVLAVALFLSACSVPDGGDLHASWSITQGTAASTCAAIGGDTIEILATSYSGRRTYQEFYDCDDLHATVPDLRPGSYELEITLYDAAGHPLSQPFSLPVEVRSNEVAEAGNFEFNFPAPGPGPTGRFTASWVVTVNGADATCADVDGSVVQIVTQGPAGQQVFAFDCNAMTATTDALPAGSYVVSIRLLDAAGKMLSGSGDGASSTVPLAGGETVSIGDFEFQFSYRKARFAIHMGGADVAGGNCTSMRPDGGAGVVREEIVLTRTGPGNGQCLLATVSGIYDASGEQKTTPTCSPYDCQQETVVHALNDLENGQYWIQVRGYISTPSGQAPCYLSSNIPFTVNNGDVDLGVIQAPFNDSLDPQRCRR